MNAPTMTRPGWWRPATRSGRLWLGIATVWPLLYLFLFVGGFMVMMLIAAPPGRPPPAEPPTWIFGPVAGMMAMHCLTIAGTLALMVVYVISVVNNPKLDQTLRIVWILLVLFFSMLALPPYWFLYVWRD